MSTLAVLAIMLFLVAGLSWVLSLVQRAHHYEDLRRWSEGRSRPASQRTREQ